MSTWTGSWKRATSWKRAAAMLAPFLVLAGMGPRSLDVRVYGQDAEHHAPDDADAHEHEGTHVEAEGAPEHHGETHHGDAHDESSGAHGAHAGAAPNPLKVDLELGLFTAMVFLALLAILGNLAWKPILASLDLRERNIADEIAAARSKNEDAKNLLVQYEEQLAGAANDVRELLEEARRDAEHTKTTIVAEAKQAARAEHARSMQDVHTATDAAVKSLAESSSALALDLAGKIVDEKLNVSDFRPLIRDTTARIVES